MLIQTPKFNRANSFTIGYCVVVVAIVLLVAIMPITAVAQTFSSGSTGADGALNDTILPSACTRGTNTITCTLPVSGVFNFTTVTIPAGVTLQFIKNARNTPVTILATGDVTINGIVDINGKNSGGIIGGESGPGGFRGGDSGIGIQSDVSDGKPGDGPGGGSGGRFVQGGGWYGGGGGFAIAGATAANGSIPERGGIGGTRYGSRTLLPLIGGSGGGGQAASNSGPGGGAGGGGGAILIASSTKILFGTSSSISSIGGNGFNNSGGAGAGGAIRLIANTISGNPSLQIRGGSGGQVANSGSYGYVRAEATDFNTFFPSTSNPNYIISKTFNPITLGNAPQLRIVSVGGVNAPASPLGSFAATPDIVVPTSTANPVQVSIQANNIPASTVVSLTLTQENGDRTTVSSTPLAGSLATSTATANVTLPTSGISVITATASVDGLLAFNNKPVFIDGEQVKRVEIAATFGGQSHVTYITASGKRVLWPTE